MIFFPGIDKPYMAKHFKRCFLSVNGLENRKSNFEVKDWIMDSGAFTRISTGKGHMPPETYAGHIRRWSRCGNLLAAVSQDYMCEEFILEITGLDVPTHQRLTIENYRRLISLDTGGTYIMPVLQGYTPAEYVAHLDAYGEDLAPGAWVGIGSVCKRNSSPGQIEAVLQQILSRRPDLKLHGFGVKSTALKNGFIRDGLFSADSMAWSYAARREGRNQHDPAEALRYAERIHTQHVQLPIFQMTVSRGGGREKMGAWEGPGRSLCRQALETA